MPEVMTVIHRESEAKRPGEALFGLFSDDPELMQNIAKDAREARDKEAIRDYGA